MATAQLKKLPLSFNACDGSIFCILRSKYGDKVDAYVQDNASKRFVVTNGSLEETIRYKEIFLLARRDFKRASDEYYKQTKFLGNN